MNTQNQHHPSFAVAQQTTNNATSWLGHRKGETKETGMGQTFIATSEGDLETIEVFSSIVASPGQVAMTLHSFDPQLQSWGPSLGSATVDFNASCNGKWIAFDLHGLHLTKNMSYGFRLESHDSYIGVGEAAGSATNPPFASGKEWKFTDNDKKGDSFSYFSLAFKVGLKAA
jgi:hypothetical protein